MTTYLLPPVKINFNDGLDLHLFDKADANDLLKLATDSTVKRFVPWAAEIISTKQARMAIQKFQRDYHEGIRARYALKKNTEFIGYVGLWPDKPAGYYEFGFALLPDFRHHGYGTRAVKELMNVARDNLAALGIVAYVHDENKASQRAILSLGLQRTDIFDAGDRRYELKF